MPFRSLIVVQVSMQELFLVGAEKVENIFSDLNRLEKYKESGLFVFIISTLKSPQTISNSPLEMTDFTATSKLSKKVFMLPLGDL